MGPSLESNGMAAAVGGFSWLMVASMGPSLESNGMNPQFVAVREYPMLQWGRRSKATECRGAFAGFEVRFGASMGPSLESNGMRRARAIRIRVSAASMGPSLESNGMTPSNGTSETKRSSRFNGAVARKQRNVCGSLGWTWCVQLQWGRRSKATECGGREHINREWVASMGPSLESNGM